jgi:Tfp pilus assembly protein PilN
MVQFNLLPDVKMAYIKARKTKRLVNLISTSVALGSLVLILILGIVAYGVQNAQIASVNKSIMKSQSSIDKQNSNISLDKILTIQNQLQSLDGLHAEKPILSRVFPYLSKLVPAQVTISKVTLLTTSSTVTIQGSTDTIESVNKFVDTLKFTVYDSKNVGEIQSVFSSVVLDSFGRDKQGASYSISLVYNPIIFSGSESGDGLVVPNKTTTRSELERPVFQTNEEKNNSAPTPTGDIK